MIATTSKCLTADELHQLLGGTLDADDFESASEHVDRCNHCQDSIDRLGCSAMSSPIDRHNDPLQAEAECQFAIHRLLHESSRSGSFPALNVEPVLARQLGPYTILGELGRGGMGTVCLAEHDRLKRRCAIKLLPPARVSTPGWLERFEREMAAVASLEHPGIVRASDAGTQDGWHYLVMEYLDGLDLGHVATAMGKINVADACEIVRQSALALGYVHGSALVHRDIKPSNLMLTRNGTVKLLDLGLVLAGDDPLSCDDRLTTVGHLMGTLPAMSPEQLLDSRRVDAATDVYSLGATLFRLIAGRWPFVSEGGIAARVLAITNESAPRLSTVREHIDAGLDELLASMLHRHAKHRPSADQVAEGIAAWTDGADLKTLIRQSEQRAVSVPEEPSRPFTAVLAAPQSPPPNTRPHRSLAGGFRSLALLAAGMLLATVIIQIKTDRGTVIVKTDGKDTQVEVVPDEVVRGEESKTDLPVETEPAPERLYLGKNLAHWMDVFQREQQIESIGQAMRAVELLSRDLPQRDEAAAMTLQLANEYGTMQIDESPDNKNSDYPGGHSPVTQRYMGYLAEVFPAYQPEPGLRAIDHQLATGNEKARTAAILMLSHYVNGVYINTNYFERKKAAQNHLASLAGSERGRQQLTGLLTHLGEAFEALELNSNEDANAAAASVSMVVSNARYARTTAWSTADEIIRVIEPDMEAPPWIEQHVIKTVRQAIATYEQRPIDPETGQAVLEETPMYGGMGGGGMMGGTGTYGRPDWVIDADVLLFALELRREGRLDVPTPFAVDVMTTLTKLSMGYGMRYTETLDLLNKTDPIATEMFVAKVEEKLTEYQSIYQETGQQDSSFAGLNQDYLLYRFGEIYAENVSDPAAALKRIMDLQSGFAKAFPTVLSPLVKIIETLSE